MPIIPVLQRPRQKDCCEFEANPAYIESSRPSEAVEQDPVSGNKTKRKKVGSFVGLDKVLGWPLWYLSSGLQDEWEPRKCKLFIEKVASAETTGQL